MQNFKRCLKLGGEPLIIVHDPLIIHGNDVHHVAPCCHSLVTVAIQTGTRIVHTKVNSGRRMLYFSAVSWRNLITFLVPKQFVRTKQAFLAI
jgi:hypothetical protein